MAKFCGKCGARLDDTGRCPNCDKEEKSASLQFVDGSAKENKPSKTENSTRNAKKKWPEKAPLSVGQKIRRFFLKLLAAVILLAVLAAGVMGALTYFHIVDIPVMNQFFTLIGLEQGNGNSASNPTDTGNSVNSGDGGNGGNNGSSPGSYEVTPPDADAYYKQNATVVAETDAKSSDRVQTEAEVYSSLAGRGFTGYPIVSNYSMDGDYYDAAAISQSSSDKHPMYQTYYTTSRGEFWTIFEINGVVMANPVSYNMQSGLSVQVMISETGTVTSYDSTTNKFYETIPNESSLIVKTVGRIDADTLENLTYGAIDEL